MCVWYCIRNLAESNYQPKLTNQAMILQRSLGYLSSWLLADLKSDIEGLHDGSLLTEATKLAEMCQSWVPSPADSLNELRGKGVCLLSSAAFGPHSPHTKMSPWLTCISYKLRLWQSVDFWKGSEQIDLFWVINDVQVYKGLSTWLQLNILLCALEGLTAEISSTASSS